MRVSTFLICLALALSPLSSRGTSLILEPESPTLNDSLNLIDEGLQMIDSPLSVISDYFKSERQELQGERSELEQAKLNLDLREQALIERARGLDSRESGLWDTWVGLDKLDKKIRQTRAWGVLIIVGALILGGVGGYAMGRL